MKNPLFILCILLASCEGRCSRIDAELDETPMGSSCLVNYVTDSGFCVSQTEIWGCRLSGVFFNKAKCARMGKLVP